MAGVNCEDLPVVGAQKLMGLICGAGDSLEKEWLPTQNSLQRIPQDREPGGLVRRVAESHTRQR